MPKENPSKWSTFKTAYTEWWKNLSLDEKVKAKAHFLKVREWNATKNKSIYPDMWNIEDIRLSQLSDKHIYRIWVFKDHPENKRRYE